jgi:hypothetical protein
VEEAEQGVTEPGRFSEDRRALCALRSALCALRSALVPFSLGLLLLSAAALKGYEVAAAPLPETSLWSSRGFLIGVIEAEFGLGLWLLSGRFPCAARWTALVAFQAFFAFSLIKVMRGEARCGCFGPAPISPLGAAGLDLAAILSLWLWHPPEDTDRPVKPCWLRDAALLIFIPLLGVPGGVVLALTRPTALDADTEIDANHTAVLLDPEKWVGRRCPLLPYTDIGADLSQGEWLVVLYHHDCLRCRAVLPTYEARARAVASHPRAPRTAFLAVPPHGEPLWQFAPDSACRQGRLDESRKWLVNTPAILRLHEGVVQTGNEG